MKRILKRNQVIIAALAIMIVIAGYLNLTGGKKTDKDAVPSVTPEDSYADGEQENELAIPVADDGSLILAENEAAKSALGEEDGTEEVDGDDTPGKAILASTQISADYFVSARLDREQTRAKNKETLSSIVNDASISDELKSEAIAALVAMTKLVELEDATEMLLEAKGFEEVVVRMEENSIDVIVNAASITEQETAIIEDTVMRKTGLTAEGIVITTVVTSE